MDKPPGEDSSGLSSQSEDTGPLSLFQESARMTEKWSLT